MSAIKQAMTGVGIHSGRAGVTMLVSGGAHSGKTQHLVDHVVALLAAGTDPAQILVFAASPDAAHALAARLGKAHPLGALVRVTVPRQVFLELLDTPEAYAATGRRARLLSRFETDFLFEDLKPTGIRSKRLREMVKFFLRGMTEMADWEEKWLVTVEEEQVYGLLKDSLAFSGGIMEQELGNVVLRYLFDYPEACAAARVAHVVVDDYQQLSRASQVLAQLLAESSLAVAADESACLTVFDSFPYAEGVEELRADTPALVNIRLDGSWAVARADVAVEKAATPAAELAYVVDRVAAAIEAGTAPADVVVAAPHRVWRANVARALAARGIACEQADDGRAVAGDMRDMNRCSVARMLTALNLVVAPDDGVAWRSWCGFGDYLTRSNWIGQLRGKYLPAGVKFAEALAAENTNAEAGLPVAVSLIEAYRQGRAAVEAAHGLEGDALVHALAEACGVTDERALGAFAELTAPFEDVRLAGQTGGQRADVFAGTSAAATLARARQRLEFPAFERADVVRVLPLERLCGVTAKVLVVCGMVNGFMPVREYFDRVEMTQEKADKLLAADGQLFTWALAKATGRVLVTGFAKADLVAAETLRLQIDRVQLDDDGKRVALVDLSVLLEGLR